MSPLDKESIQSKLIRIRRNVAELKKLSKLPYEKYVNDLKNTLLAERLLHVNIEAMLDIGSHIISEESLGEPLEYRDIFILLVKGGILPRQQEEQFTQLVGLRNRIVHLYEDIDHQLLYQALKKELSDFDLFVKSIVRYLKKKRG